MFFFLRILKAQNFPTQCYNLICSVMVFGKDFALASVKLVMGDGFVKYQNKASISVAISKNATCMLTKEVRV